MIKSVATGICVLALTGTLAFAKSGPAQGEATSGVSSQSAQTMKADPMDSNARMMGRKMMMKKKMMMMKKRRMMMMKKKGMM